MPDRLGSATLSRYTGGLMSDDGLELDSDALEERLVGRRSTIRRHRRALARAVLTAAILVSVAACTYSGTTPGKPIDTNAEDAEGRANLSILQFVIDTGQIDPAKIPPGVLLNGTVAQTATAGVFGQRYERLYIGPNRQRILDEEIPRLTGLLNGPGPASDAQAGAVVVQELVDAGYLDGQSFGVDAGKGLVQASPTVTGWVTAHAGDPLCPGVNVTVAQEQHRVAGFVIAAENDSPHT